VQINIPLAQHVKQVEHECVSRPIWDSNKLQEASSDHTCEWAGADSQTLTAHLFEQIERKQTAV